MLSRELVTAEGSAEGCDFSPFDRVSFVPAGANVIQSQDCAGAILYSSDRAVEVAIEAMQSLGGNGYINGVFDHLCSQYCILTSPTT